MFSSQNSSQASLRPSAGGSSFQRSQSSSSFSSQGQGSTFMHGSDSHSMSTGSQEFNAYPRSSQESPSRRLVQLYNGRTPLFRRNAVASNSGTNSNMTANGERLPPKEIIESLTILTFLVKDMVEKVGSLKTIVEKLPSVTDYNNFLTEIQSRITAIQQSFSEKIGLDESYRSKIADLEADIHEKSFTIHKLEMELNDAKRQTPDISNRDVITATAAAIELSMTTYLKKANEEREDRFDRMQKAFITSLNESIMKLQNTVELMSDSRCNCITPNQSLHSPQRQPTNFRRSSMTLSKPPLKFLHDFKPMVQQTRRSAATAYRRNSKCSPSVPSKLTLTPLSAKNGVTSQRSVAGLFGMSSRHSWSGTPVSHRSPASKTVFEVGQAHGETSPSSSSSDLPEIIFEKLVTPRKRLQESVPDGGIFDDEEIVNCHMENMTI